MAQLNLDGQGHLISDRKKSLYRMRASDPGGLRKCAKRSLSRLQRALENAKEEKQAHGEIVTYHPGFLFCQDTYL
ncbi:MAG TPA: hypothetical protein VIG33_06520 [Pseudobdellovibrionaceae bacterium]